MLDNLNKYNVVLASKSPRRQELLRGIGVDFVVFTKEVDESYPDATPLRDVDPLLSLKKAEARAFPEKPLLPHALVRLAIHWLGGGQEGNGTFYFCLNLRFAQTRNSTRLNT